MFSACFRFHFLHFGHNFFQEQAGVLGEAEVEQHFHRQVIIVDLGIQIHLCFLRHIVLHQIIFQLVTVCDNACALEQIFHCFHNVGFVGIQQFQFLDAQQRHQIGFRQALDVLAAQQFGQQLFIPSHTDDEIIVADVSTWRNINGTHDCFQQKQVRGTPFTAGDIVEITHHADDFGSIVQINILHIIQHLVLNGILPVEQIDILFQLCYTVFQLDHITAILFKELDQRRIDLVDFSLHRSHGSIQLVIDSSNQVKGQQVLLRKALQGSLSGKLCCCTAAVDLILQALIAAGNCTPKTAQSLPTGKLLLIALAVRHGGNALKNKAVDFLPGVLGGSNDGINAGVQVCLLLLCQCGRRDHIQFSTHNSIPPISSASSFFITFISARSCRMDVIFC